MIFDEMFCSYAHTYVNICLHTCAYRREREGEGEGERERDSDPIIELSFIPSVCVYDTQRTLLSAYSRQVDQYVLSWKLQRATVRVFKLSFRQFETSTVLFPNQCVSLC